MDRVASPPSFESLKNNKKVRDREGREVKVDNSLLNVITDVSAYVFSELFLLNTILRGKSHDPIMIYSGPPLYCPPLYRHPRLSPRNCQERISPHVNSPVIMPPPHIAIRHRF